MKDARLLEILLVFSEAFSQGNGYQPSEALQ